MASSKTRPFVVVWRDTIRDSGLSKTEKLVAYTIASYFDSDASKPQRRSFQTIADHASLSKRAVPQAVESLEKYGAIRVVRTQAARVDKHGRALRGHYSHTYELLPLTLQQLPRHALSTTLQQVPRDDARDSMSRGKNEHGDVATTASVLEESLTRTTTSYQLDGETDAGLEDQSANRKRVRALIDGVVAGLKGMD